MENQVEIARWGDSFSHLISHSPSERTILEAFQQRARLWLESEGIEIAMYTKLDEEFHLNEFLVPKCFNVVMENGTIKSNIRCIGNLVVTRATCQSNFYFLK